MYAYIDRPVAELALFEANILLATRKWVHAISLSSSSSALIVNSDDPFDSAMRVLHQGSAGSLVIHRPCHTVIGEFEAILLGLWRQVKNGMAGQAKKTAALIIEPGKAETLVAAMQRLI